MSVNRRTLLEYLDSYLRPDDYPDYGPQGLQVEGRADVGHIVTGVSACVGLFEAAAAAGADLILVHHGLLWDSDSHVVKGGFRRRLGLLLNNEMTLAAYHLCLDAHPDVGNNALAARALGLTELAPWGQHQGRAIGYRGRWPGGVSASAALAKVDGVYGGHNVAFMYGPDPVESVGIISGGAQRDITAAIEDGLDMFVTGEVSEFVMHAAQEGPIHFVGAGHHRTERLGIRALGEHVAHRFGLQHEFIDVPNPV